VALEAVAGTGGANSGEARRSLAGEGLEEGLGVTGVGVLAEARVGAAPEVGRDGDRHRRARQLRRRRALLLPHSALSSSLRSIGIREGGNIESEAWGWS
jgi:hypothetical protein